MMCLVGKPSIMSFYSLMLWIKSQKTCQSLQSVGKREPETPLNVDWLEIFSVADDEFFSNPFSPSTLTGNKQQIEDHFLPSPSLVFVVPARWSASTHDFLVLQAIRRDYTRLGHGDEPIVAMTSPRASMFPIVQSSRVAGWNDHIVWLKSINGQQTIAQDNIAQHLLIPADVWPNCWLPFLIHLIPPIRPKRRGCRPDFYLHQLWARR